MPNVAEIIKDHVTLEVRCLDRLYLNAYVPRLQSGGGVIDFLVRACGQKIASPAIFGQITTPFRRALRAWAGRHHIPWVEFRTRLEIWPAAGHGRAQRALPFPLDRRRAANAQLRPLAASLLGTSYTTRQMGYDLRRLRRKGLVKRLDHQKRYVLTPYGRRAALFLTKVHARVLRPGWQALDRL